MDDGLGIGLYLLYCATFVILPHIARCAINIVKIIMIIIYIWFIILECGTCLCHRTGSECDGSRESTGNEAMHSDGQCI